MKKLLVLCFCCWFVTVHAVFGLLSFAPSGLLRKLCRRVPGVYTPGYALLRPFGPNVEDNL